MLLTLPKLAPDIPVSFRFGAIGQGQLKMALILSRLGWLTDDDFASIKSTTTNAATVLSLLRKAWDRAVGHLYDFRLLSCCATLSFPTDDCFYFDDGVEQPGHYYAGIAFDSGTPEWMAGGNIFEALEAQRKGLGATAVSLIDSVLSEFGFPHTISGVLAMVSYTDWMGESNEETVIADLLEQGVGEDEMEVPRRADVVDGIPEWAYCPGEQLTTKQLKSEAKRMQNTYLREIVLKVAALSKIAPTGDLFPLKDDECAYPNFPLVVIGWATPDQFDRYIDNHFAYYCQGETPEFAGAIRFEITEKEISEAIATLQHTGIVLKTLDDLLILIKEQNEL